MKKLIIIACLFIAAAVYATDMQISHIVGGSDDDGEILDRRDMRVKLLTNTLAATADSSIVTFQTGHLKVGNANSLIGYFAVRSIYDTSSTSLDSVKAYLYTGYRDTTDYKFLLDSVRLVAAGTGFFAVESAGVDTLLKPFVWLDIQLIDTSNLATDSANINDMRIYDLDAKLFLKGE